MPSFVGVFKIVSNSGSLINGDTVVVSPASNSKTNYGAGSGITGDFSATFTLFSTTNTSDPDIVEAGGNNLATGP